jgi:hypothetical protein
MHNTAYHGISGMSGGPRTVSAMRPRQIRSTLGSSQLYVRTREVCHRLSCQSGAELAQLSCWRAEAKPVGASATGAQGHPIDGIRPGRGQPWIMDARCHAMPCMLAGMMLFVPAQHAFALTKPGGLLRVLTCHLPRSNSSANQHDTCSLTLRAACSGIAPWLSEF